MITANVIHRVFCIKYGEDFGVGFTVDVEKKQYLITAKHVVEHIKRDDQVLVLSNGDYIPLQVKLVGHCDGDVDISVLSVDYQLTPPDLPLSATSSGLVYGQDVFFLGFPYKLVSKYMLGQNGYPLPFVKKAIVSCFDGNLYLLDGHNNHGFSGGPVVFKPAGSNDFQVAAVISGYRSVPLPVYKSSKETQFTYDYNTGIIDSYSVDRAVEVINKNPIGFSLL